MSAAASYSHGVSYRLPAGFLTLAVHVTFFLLLYLGISWQSQPPQGMAVDLWSDLPTPANVPIQPARASTPPVEPPKTEPAKPQTAQQPVASQADIQVKQKKNQHSPPKENEKPAHKPQMTQAERREAQAEMNESMRQQEQAEQKARATQAAEAAAITNEVGKYIGLIRAKIRRNVVLPPDVADDAQVEFEITLLPGGEVFEVKLTRKSGNAAYDSSVERAIWKATPLPVPADADLFGRNFRKLHLRYKPKD